jgi:hypothetical protein
MYLRRFGFPSAKAVKDRHAERRARDRQFMARIYREEIDRIAAAQDIPKYEAKQKVVEHWKLQSVEALDSFLKREQF